ncbi:MAG: nucleotide exchange factor GrpE [Holosporales bacterium]|jgi:molecular chaperone GrpE|nr:nucleotide exchange factor GrpE [Holosporales bacterium]
MQDLDDKEIVTEKTEGDASDLPDEQSESDLLNSKIEELEDRLLRSVAELQNLQKRSEKEKADLARYSISGFAKDVLMIRDNLKLALENCPDESEELRMVPIVDGIKLTITEMDKVLARHGITLIDSMDKEFDPHLHQAIVEIEAEDQRPGTVIRVMQDGFMIHDRLLRPALVGVSKKNTPS